MLRVSTFSLYRNGEQTVMDSQRELMRIQARVSSGKRIASPAEDPIGAADATAARASLAQFDQFAENQGHARYLLNLAEDSLAHVIEGARTVKEKLIAAGNGAFGAGERKMIAGELRGILERIVGLANSPDGVGGYLFAGSREIAAPFFQSGMTVSFAGDATLQKLEISKDRFQQVKFSGDALFLKMRPGNGTFTTANAAGNTGNGSIDTGAVVNPALLTGSAYSVDFTVTAGVTTYQVVRASDSAVVASGNYTNPQQIAFDGMSVTLDGAPADGDSFDVAPAGYRSIFETLATAITLLETGAATQTAQANFKTELSGLLASMDGALDHLVLKRSAIGSSLAELDSYEALNGDRQFEYQGRLSQIEDLDLAAGISELNRRQTAYDAAIRSYSTISKLSLFDFIG
ncbi:MAG TPA: flagellar hook-associated protein FlgL [Burkholderiaceae bacterium]|nr:flagellar hook-associated protein FlgL [Burkholderiaceae bacterium]